MCGKIRELQNKQKQMEEDKEARQEAILKSKRDQLKGRYEQAVMIAWKGQIQEHVFPEAFRPSAPQ